MNINSSYFQLPTLRLLLLAIDRRFHPYRHRSIVMLRDNTTEVRWTERAEQAFSDRNTPLIAEMQLYFSCVVKKRILFHEHSEMEGVPVDERLHILFRSVESTSCDPEEFVQNFPVKRELMSPAAGKLHPSALEIDFSKGSWHGEFFIGSHKNR